MVLKMVNLHKLIAIHTAYTCSYRAAPPNRSYFMFLQYTQQILQHGRISLDLCIGKMNIRLIIADSACYSP
jgi:hypothetical protein